MRKIIELGDDDFADASERAGAAPIRSTKRPGGLRCSEGDAKLNDMRWSRQCAENDAALRHDWRTSVAQALLGPTLAAIVSCSLTAPSREEFVGGSPSAAHDAGALPDAGAGAADADGPGRGTPIPTTWRRFASFEANLSDEVDKGGWETNPPFQVMRSNDVGGTDGSFAAKIVTNGGGGCSCPRMQFQDFSYGPGRELWIKGSWYFTDASALSWTQFMALRHYVAEGDPSNYSIGFVVERGSTMMIKMRGNNTDVGSRVLVSLGAAPQGRWLTVAVHLKLSPIDGQGLTEAYLDGQLVGSSTAANMLTSAPVHVLFAGLDYFLPDNGNTTVYVDAIGLSD